MASSSFLGGEERNLYSVFWVGSLGLRRDQEVVQRRWLGWGLVGMFLSDLDFEKLGHRHPLCLRPRLLKLLRFCLVERLPEHQCHLFRSPHHQHLQHLLKLCLRRHQLPRIQHLLCHHYQVMFPPQHLEAHPSRHLSFQHHHPQKPFLLLLLLHKSLALVTGTE
jgi:hypothetical protein